MPRHTMRWAYAAAIVAVCGIVWFAWRSATTVQVKHYPITGTVVALHPESQTVTVHNENMPGVMEPMNMSYEVKDAQAFSQLKTGEIIHATLVTDRQSFWRLEDIQSYTPK